jgi:hypothetical protein
MHVNALMLMTGRERRQACNIECQSRASFAGALVFFLRNRPSTP